MTKCGPMVASNSGTERGGRPVTSTTRIPACSAAAKAAPVRADRVPSLRSSVPSRSVAMSFGGATRDTTGMVAMTAPFWISRRKSEASNIAGI
jgi:hypothetical protein